MKAFLLSATLVFASKAISAPITYNANNSQFLQLGLLAAIEEKGNQFTIVFTDNIQLGPSLTLSTTANPISNPILLPLNCDVDFALSIPASSQPLILSGANYTLSGSNTFRGLFCRGGELIIENLTFSQLTAQGGNGGLGLGGGSGAGMGGALFIGENADVTLTNTSFVECRAIGGSPVSSGAQGGASVNLASSGTGGSGYGGKGAQGGGGCGLNASGTTGGLNFDSSSGSGGDAGSPPSGGNDGGGGGAPLNNSQGGTGGFAAGGGGADTIGSGGDGGFGGGGGGSFNTGAAGDGGFGGGGGGSAFNASGQGIGGYGGGNGAFISGGGAAGGSGASFGGAIFISKGATVTFQDSVTFNNNSVVGTTGPNPGLTQGSDIFAMSSATMVFNLTSDTTLSNPIEGNQGNETPSGSIATNTGGLIKQGSAILTLTGDNTFTGMTTISEGELKLRGSVVSDVTVETGAILSDNLAILVDQTGNNGGNLINNGIVAPGSNGFGQVQLEGDFTQTATGQLKIDLNPLDNAVNKINLPNGTATLDGELQLIFRQGNYIAGTEYRIINGSTSGAFQTVSTAGPLAGSVQHVYDSTRMIVTILDPAIFLNVTIPSGPPSASADAIQAQGPLIRPRSDFAKAVEELGALEGEPLSRALYNLTPTMFGSLDWIHARNSSLVAGLVEDHLFQPCEDCCCSPYHLWVTGYGNFMDNRKSFDQLNPFDAKAGGVLLGMDGTCFCDFTYGIGLGYTHTSFDWDGRGSGQINSYYGTVYGSWSCSCFTADIALVGGGSDQKVRRNLAFGSINRVAKSDPSGYFFTAHLAARGAFDFCGFRIEPFALMDSHYFHQGSATEKGADSLNLNIRSHTQNIIRSEAGLFTYYTLDCACYCIAPYLGLSWVGEFPIGTSKYTATFVGQHPPIKVDSYDSDVHLASPEIGFKVTNFRGLSTSANYKGLYNGKTRINQFNLKLEWSF